MTERGIPDDPVSYVRERILAGEIYWTYHVNMRLRGRFISREAIVDAVNTFELVESYPDDKYFPSYLLLGRSGADAFHVLFGVDVAGNNVRVVTAYRPSRAEWLDDLKTRRSEQ